MESISLLKKIPLFASLRDNELKNIQGVCIKRSYRKNQPIVLEDDSSINTIFIIIKGKVKVSVVGPEGREAILAILKEGDFFGEMSIIDGEPRSATVISIKDSDLLLLRREFRNAFSTQRPVFVHNGLTFSHFGRHDQAAAGVAVVDGVRQRLSPASQQMLLHQ